ncbi:MAG: radical SAM protein [Spirochaetota bacterium]
MQSRHYNIPIFFPDMGCPHQCVFCNQKNISGAQADPNSEQVVDIIEKHLSTMRKGSKIEIAFFGGSFTGIPVEEQRRYLDIAYRYVKNGRVSGIRLSTRPDYISEDAVALLKQYGVTAIELGAQSMDDEVLRLSARGHTAEDVVRASAIIKRAEISLGLQMMTGLPGDTPAKAEATARALASLGADTARLYPALVIKGTALERMYLEKKYAPLTLDEAVEQAVIILQIFEERGINVIRMGLHPSEGLLSGDALVAGPFHRSFRELVLTRIWKNLLGRLLRVPEHDELAVYVNPAEYNYAVGYGAGNKKMLMEKFRKVIFINERSVKGRNYASVCM